MAHGKLSVFDQAFDLPLSAPPAPPVAAWIALARAFDHSWVAKLDALPADVELENLGALAKALGVHPSGCGATRSHSDTTWEHVSKTRRIKWRVAPPYVEIWVYRPGERQEGQEVIFLTVDLEGESTPLVDVAVLLNAEYGLRHVRAAHTALFALATNPPGRGGITKKHAQRLVKMIQAGAS